MVPSERGRTNWLPRRRNSSWRWPSRIEVCARAQHPFGPEAGTAPMPGIFGAADQAVQLGFVKGSAPARRTR